VTPVVAVLRELKTEHPRAEVRFWCDRHFAPQARSIMASYDPSIRVQTVASGKFRRYHHLTKLQHLTIPSVVFPNIRDAFKVIFGVGQSVVRMVIWRPDVVFAKGGYVCLPVGWAAWLLRIPLVIHDSETHPGLTNRLLAPLAKRIGTGVSLDHYDYPAAKSRYVGTPIGDDFVIKTQAQQNETKQILGFDSTRPMVVFVGGGQGSKQINDAVAFHLDKLLEHANVVLISGAAQYDELRSITPENDKRFVLKSFISSGMADLLGAADVVVTRAGATFLLELAALAKPTIVIPSKRLVWQVEHVKDFVQNQAVLVLDEDKFEEPTDTSLLDTVVKLLNSPVLQEKLSKNFHRLARPHAAEDMAAMIVHAARKQR
jgi:UDP-N-acetylglucosamine--N-acetylmuramyl-(pentapeptide) pyrophosphoryl-undecaprenol N-acetylglucosamine transferase